MLVLGVGYEGEETLIWCWRETVVLVQGPGRRT